MPHEIRPWDLDAELIEQGNLRCTILRPDGEHEKVLCFSAQETANGSLVLSRRSVVDGVPVASQWRVLRADQWAEFAYDEYAIDTEQIALQAQAIESAMAQQRAQARGLHVAGAS